MGNHDIPNQKSTFSTRVKAENVNRVCFRGDDRDPDVIFKKGFQARDKLETPIYDTDKSQMMGTPNEVADIDTHTAVCVTTDYFVAPIFPMSKEKQTESTWVYAVYVEKAFHTKIRQVLHGMNGEDVYEEEGDLFLKKLKTVEKKRFLEARTKDPESVLWAWFGDELAVERGIPPENIIGAVKVVNRNFKEGKHQLGLNGVEYSLGEYKPNKNYKPKGLEKSLRQEYKSLTEKLIKGELTNPEGKLTPSIKDGLSKVEKVVKVEKTNVKEAQIQSIDDLNVNVTEDSYGSISQLRSDLARMKVAEREIGKKRAQLEKKIRRAENKEVFWV